MRLAFVSLMAGASWGGSEELWSDTALLALEQGHDVFVSVYNWGELPVKLRELKNKGAHVHLRQRYNSSFSLFKKATNYFINRSRLIGNPYLPIFTFAPDSIFINQGDNFCIAVHHKQLKELLEKHGIPYILMCHNHAQYSSIPQSNIYPEAVSFYKKAKRVLFVSERMKYVTQRQLCCDLPNASIVQNTIGIKDLKILNWPESETVQFAAVGYLGGQKGQDILIDILSGYEWRQRNWKLNLYGLGYGEKYLKDLCIYRGISEKVIFHGFCEVVADIWESNHILLIPSAGEGLPISLVEAMACGRPVVVTDVGGNAEVIKDGESGFIAEAPSAYSFEKALEKAWQNKDMWKGMGEKAFNYIKDWLDVAPEKTLLNYIINARG